MIWKYLELTFFQQNMLTLILRETALPSPFKLLLVSNFVFSAMYRATVWLL